ncbi:MAG: DNA-processing protein DprA [Candidatus Campbellbacteria bacterium]|nr:DNA-processing protein DprA [Candidatus Campbellbacteria bacterium]
MTYPIKTLKGEDIPEYLREIPTAPKALFLKGELPTDSICLTVVGPREYTEYGRKVCETLIYSLSSYPIVIVSGLALGIDTKAHEAAISAGLKTIAIVGSGIDHESIYPRTNVPLAEKILKSGGAVMSEYKEGTKVARYHFPNRNRLLAGISQATLVIEAEEKSGTLITARLAVDYNRDVLTVQQSIFSPTSKGVQWLLKNGATPVSSGEDIAEILGIEKKKQIDTDLTDDEKIVINLLNKPKTRDDICEESKMSAERVSRALGSLEIKGCVEEKLGMVHSLI